MTASATRKALHIFSILKHRQNHTILSYRKFHTLEIVLLVLTLDHIENVFLCFFKTYGHGKLDLKFVHGTAEK